MAVKLVEQEKNGWTTSQVTVRVVRNSASSPENEIESNLQKRAERGSRQKLWDTLAKSPDVEPDEANKLSLRGEFQGGAAVAGNVNASDGFTWRDQEPSKQEQ